MIRVSKYKEDVLQNRYVELFEKSIGSIGVRLRNVGDQFQTHVEAGVFDLAVVVLACPHARVDDKLELTVI